MKTAEERLEKYIEEYKDNWHEAINNMKNYYDEKTIIFNFPQVYVARRLMAVVFIDFLELLHLFYYLVFL